MAARKSTARTMSSAASGGGVSDVEIKNTGLRPSWDVFWALELEDEDSPDGRVRSTFSSNKSDPLLRHMRFVTGSEWIGEWDSLGMTGMGIYKMPHGVTYEGTMKAGVFEGIGVLRYPNGGSLEGLWYEGVLRYWQYLYSDGMMRDSAERSSTYCRPPDRRFFSEHIQGLKPAETEQQSNTDPPREIPPGCYDVGYGIYNPRTKCVTDFNTDEIISIPTADEEKWIMENCRCGDVNPIGYAPHMYKNWGAKPSVPSMRTQSKREDPSHEIMSLIEQEGHQLDHPSVSRLSQNLGRTTSLQFRVEPPTIRDRRELGSSRSIADIEFFLRKILADINRQRQADGTAVDVVTEDDNASEEVSVMKILQDITTSYSTKLDKIFRDVSGTSSSRQTNEPSADLNDKYDEIGRSIFFGLAKPFSLLDVGLTNTNVSQDLPQESTDTSSEYLISTSLT